MNWSNYIKGMLLLLLTMLSACSQRPDNAVRSNQLPDIYPDYADVTIPVNICPLNFLVRGDDVEAVFASATDGKEMLEAGGNGNEVCFSLDDWHDFLANVVGKNVSVTVSVKKGGQWTEYKPFSWSVVADSIDSHLSYRLIEPDYEVFNNLEIEERDLESFETRSLCNWGQVGNKCMNCHVYGGQSSSLSMMYVRGQGGGAFLNRDGKLRKLNIKTDDMVSGSVYGGFSPSGRYFCFSANVIIPAFHSMPSKRLEVYDTSSDLYVADLDRNVIIRSSQLEDSLYLETFPSFSPDGKYVYFCRAPKVTLPFDIANLQYSLCRVAFDEQSGQLADSIETVVDAHDPRFAGKGSVSHPRISPDGRYLLYNVAAYGTFPIWHREADLRMLRLSDMSVDSLSIVNSNKSDTYHSWSSNSRWFVFASKRDDGLYGKPYFCYVDKEGKAHKPFVLPQRYPSFYDNCLKSFNLPELGRGQVPFTADDIRKLLEKEAEPFK